MDVRLPDGTIIKGVPDGMSKADLTAKLQANGYDVSKLMQAPNPLESAGAAINAEPTPAPEPTTTQKIYRAVRPYVAPTIEALGAAGGGLIGGGAGLMGGGPVGAAAGGVAGAGLGYGMAKEALELGDVYLGGKAPRQGAARVVEPVKNVLEGATYEAGGRAVGPALGWAAGKVADLRQIPAQKAANIARNALGPDLPEVLNALKAAKGQPLTPGQATADITSPTWQALVDRAMQRDPRFLEALKASQGEASLNALAKLAGGATATETRAASEAAKNALTSVTTPMRESALKRANLGRYVADEAALRQAHDLATLTGSGAAIDPKAFVAQATGAEKALRSVGVKPLESEALIRSISATADNPAFAGNDLVNGAVKNVADDIAKWTGQGGVIDANALEAIRKNSVNAAIAQLRPGADATAQRNLAAGVLSKIKPAIDDAIEAAGGSGWRDYLKTHAQGMRNIAEKNLTGEALNLWKNNKDAFVKLVQGESPDAVEKILGPGSYNIAKEVSDNAMSVLEDQAAKAIRDAKVKGQVTAGQDALKELMAQNISKWRLPSYLSVVASSANKGLEYLESKIGKSTLAKLTESLKTPEGAANLLETLPAAERNRVLNLLSNPTQWKPGAAAGAIVGAKNALAPESEIQNALVK